MAVNLLYWYHVMFEANGENLSTMADKMNLMASLPRICTEEQFRRLDWKPDLVNCYRLVLGRHSVYDSIPVFKGFTPSFDFDELGFKIEGEVDLLEDFAEFGEIEGLVGSVKMIKGENVPRARALAGTDQAYESKRLKVEHVFNRLNADDTGFVAFRTYRSFPAVWDIIHIYSQGNFEM